MHCMIKDIYPNERDKKIPPANVFARDKRSVFCEKFLLSNGIPQQAIFNKDNMICNTSLRAGKLNSNFDTADTVDPPLHDNKPLVLIQVLSFLCKFFSMTLTFGAFIIFDDDDAMSKYVTNNRKTRKHDTICIILATK